MVIAEKDRKGSRYRCLLLTQLEKSDFIRRMNKLCEHTDLKVDEHDLYNPIGFKSPDELKLTDKKAEDFFKRSNTDYEKTKDQINQWWLEHTKGANTPNWDIVCTCKIKEKPGLILIEAKAHIAELSKSGKTLTGESKNNIHSKENHQKIGQAIKEANNELNKYTSNAGFYLSRDSHYQLSNRFAFAWKLASLGIPVAIVYLGFLNVYEIGPNYFRNHSDWEGTLKSHAEGIIPQEIWNGKPVMINGIPLYAMIKSMEVQAQSEILSINGVKL